MKILIVDDSLTIRKIVTRYLLKHGYEQIDEAVDGQEAIELLQQHNYGCMFLDINMPRLDGFGVLKWLSQRQCHNHMHTVIMSTEIMQFSAKKNQEMGIHTIIPKPFTGNEFEKIAVSLVNVIASEKHSVPLVYDGPILIIDDSTAMRTIIRKQLSNLNCLNVTEAIDGKDGLEKISEWAMLYEEDETIGIVFLDLIMPKMDGLQLIEVLENKGLLSKLQIILLSGSIDMALTMIDGISIMAALPKPFQHEAFVQALRPLIEGKKQIQTFGHNDVKIFFDAEALKYAPISLMSLPAENFEELVEYLFSPFESLAMEMSFPKERSREIPNDTFESLIKSVYRPVLLIDTHIVTYAELEFLYDKSVQMDQIEAALRAIRKDDIQHYCKNNIVPKNHEYIELRTKIGRYKLAVNTLIERKNKLAQHYKATPSKEIKGAYEKHEHDLLNYRNALENHEKLLEGLSATLEAEYKAELEYLIEMQLKRIVVTSNQIRAAFDRALWRGMRNSMRFRAYCNSRGRHVELSTQSWLENEAKSMLEQHRQFFEKDFCSSILIIGFKESGGGRIRDELKKFSPSYNVQTFSTWSIKNYAVPYVPSLLIFNRESKEFSIEQYIQEVAKHFEVTSDTLNTLIVYEGSIKSEELLHGNSLYNLKLKNYIKVPKNSSEFALMGMKIKSLIF
jgi:CheY-like chemotaxis protein